MSYKSMNRREAVQSLAALGAFAVTVPAHRAFAPMKTSTCLIGRAMTFPISFRTTWPNMMRCRITASSRAMPKG